MKKLLCNAAIAIVAVLGVVSCESELSPIGAEIIGEDPTGRIQEEIFDVKTYSVPINPVQTSNFSSFPFGAYQDPVYGTSTYGFASQVNLATVNPNFSRDAILKEVILEVPYYSTAIDIDNEETTYRLDSIYGGAPVDLKIYRNNYFLSSFDSQNVEQRAVYYSDFENTIDANKGEIIYSAPNFFPSAEEIEIFEEVDGETVVSERLTPRLRVSLSIEQWKELLFVLEPDPNMPGETRIVDARPELATASNFQNYFRGLYFKVDGMFNDGFMAHFNLSNARIIYSVETETDILDVNDSDGDGDMTDFVRVESDFTINFNGNKVGFVNHNFPAAINAAIAASNNPTMGAENLYLKGGPGSLAVIELFGQATTDADGESPELSRIIANDWLINEASLEFYVNLSDANGGENEPERILIYNYDNNTVLADFVVSGTSVNGIDANLSHLGRLERTTLDDLSSTGIKYKIRLTQHLNNIIQGNIENHRLAIVVSQNVALLGNSRVSDGPISNPDLEFLPTGAAISHEGTILHGNLASGTNEDKRPKLRVFYSETIN